MQSVSFWSYEGQKFAFVRDLLIKFLVIGLVNKTLLLWGRCNSCKIVLWLQVELQLVQMSLKVMCCYYYGIPGGCLAKFPASPWGLFAFMQEVVSLLHPIWRCEWKTLKKSHKSQMQCVHLWHKQTGGWGSSAKGQKPHWSWNVSYHTECWQWKIKHI